MHPHHSLKFKCYLRHATFLSPLSTLYSWIPLAFSPTAATVVMVGSYYYHSNDTHAIPFCFGSLSIFSFHFTPDVPSLPRCPTHAHTQYASVHTVRIQRHGAMYSGSWLTSIQAGILCKWTSRERYMLYIYAYVGGIHNNSWHGRLWPYNIIRLYSFVC